MAFGASGVDVKAPRLNVTISPTHAVNGQADGLDISYTLSGASEPAGPLTLELDTLAPGLQRTSDMVSDLNATDRLGALPLGAPVITSGKAGEFQTWTTARSPQGDVRVSYHMHVAKNAAVKRGPQVDLQSTGGGVSGGFVGFLLLPRVAGSAFATRVDWTLAAGEIAVSSYGEGAYEGLFTADQLRGTLFLAGHVVTYRAPGQRHDGGLSVYALGMSQENIKDVGDWTARAYAAEIKAFKIDREEPYRFMIRSFTGSANPSGRAAEHSFMLYVPPGANPGTTVLHSVVAHEMVHSLTRPLEKENIDGDWYTEGVANYLSITIPYAAGLYTSREYLELVKAESAGYYTNALRSLPNSKFAETVWSGRNAWLLPYNRGSIYFADLDAKLKAKGLNTTVLDLVNEMSRRIDNGEPSDHSVWLSVLAADAGPWAISDWEAMMSGRVIFPASGAFGKCMQSIRTNVRIFDLGFSSPIRLTAGSVIGGVVKGSPADVAGLRNGDVLVTGTDINPAAESLDADVSVTVMRAGKTRSISFQPGSRKQEGVSWQDACKK